MVLTIPFQDIVLISNYICLGSAARNIVAISDLSGLAAIAAQKLQGSVNGAYCSADEAQTCFGDFWNHQGGAAGERDAVAGAPEMQPVGGVGR